MYITTAVVLCPRHTLCQLDQTNTYTLHSGMLLFYLYGNAGLSRVSLGVECDSVGQGLCIHPGPEVLKCNNLWKLFELVFHSLSYSPV